MRPHAPLPRARPGWCARFVLEMAAAARALLEANQESDTSLLRGRAKSR